MIFTAPEAACWRTARSGWRTRDALWTGRGGWGPAALHERPWLGLAFAALDMLSDQHVAVEHPDQVIRNDRIHCHVKAELM